MISRQDMVTNQGLRPTAQAEKTPKGGSPGLSSTWGSIPLVHPLQQPWAKFLILHWIIPSVHITMQLRDWYDYPVGRLKSGQGCEKNPTFPEKSQPSQRSLEDVLPN